MKQKIIKIGSSIGVVIPKPIAEERGFIAGGVVTLHTVTDSNAIRIEPAEVATIKKVSPELVAWAEDAVERYRPALEALADKKTLDIDPAVLVWTNEFIEKNKALLQRLAVIEKRPVEEIAGWLENNSKKI